MNGTTATFEETRELIRKGRHRLSQALATVHNLSIELTKKNEQLLYIRLTRGSRKHDVPIGQWQLAFIAKELIYSTNDLRDNPLTLDNLALYANWYTSIPSPTEKLFESVDSEDKTQAIIRMFLQIDYEQLKWQAHASAFEIARHLIMYDDICSQSDAFPVNCNDAFRNAVGMSISEFMSIGFIAFALANQPDKPFFIASELAPDRFTNEVVNRENANRFLEVVSTDYRGFRERVVSEEQEVKGFEKLAFNPLVKWPIIKTDWKINRKDDTYISPIPILLVERITEGIYWDIVDDRSDQTFQVAFGLAFQEYVGQLLQEYCDSYVIFPEQEYTIGKNRLDSCDWIIIEGDAAILIECKTTRFSKRTKITGQPELFSSEMNRNFVKGLSQLIKTMKAIEDGYLPSLPKVKHYYGLVIVSDHLFMTVDVVRGIATDGVRTEYPDFTEDEINRLQWWSPISIQDIERYAPRIPELGVIGVFDRANWDNLDTTSSRRETGPALLMNRFDKFFDEFKSSLLGN